LAPTARLLGYAAHAT